MLEAWKYVLIGQEIKTNETLYILFEFLLKILCLDAISSFTGYSNFDLLQLLSFRKGLQQPWGSLKVMKESPFQILSIHSPIRLAVKQTFNVAPFPVLIIYLSMQIFWLRKSVSFWVSTKMFLLVEDVM